MRGLSRVFPTLSPVRARIIAVLITTVSVAMECVNIWVTAQLPQPSYTPLPFSPEDVAGTAFPIIGALLVFQRPRLVIGWLLCLGGLCSALNSLTMNLASLDATMDWMLLPDAVWTVADVSWKLTILFLAVLLPLLYPDGRLPSPRWRPLIWFTLAVLTAGTLSSEFLPFDVSAPQSSGYGVGTALNQLTDLAMILAFVSLAVRFRKASTEERRQILWPLIAIATVIVPWVIGSSVWWLASFTIPLVPVAITFSVLRHRLYGIDTLITRTLVGAGLVGVIGGVYVAVGTASSLFLSDVDRIGGLIAALCAGAFFHPMRRLLQRGADRLLYGSKGDPVALAEELRRRLQRTDPVGGLVATLEVLREGLAVSGTGVRFQDGWPEETVAGTLDEVARDIRLVWHGQPVGRLLIGPPGVRRLPAAHNERVIAALTPYVADAAHAVRLVGALRRSRERIVTTREEERRRLRRDLHDGLGQSLSGMAMSINAARLSLHASPEVAERLLVELRSGMDTVTSDIRHLVYGLRPPALDDLGLARAVEQMAGPGVTVEVRGDLTGLPAAAEVAAYRIVQEALTNVRKHAEARTVRVSLERDGDHLAVRVSDDGVGVPVDRRSGVGLASMRERAAELGGTCIITSPPEGGTMVEAVLPVNLNVGI
ncbi:signal transduction histidine kinase [Streptosporangium becharense]|uniref:Oxygen sensor histidine kinase NreB n=1 Tax=Streptosporangium becharense TaxID=1816182 RepID=A0A7W9IDK9_9ACTN|nr:sensor histidine kinase [Streptosporangium becharense]MBB2911948.1 signal transduction histidine kinase [Streptosporangium becharense]MBB5818495.1 signal transduction histidine kinase [Streptosporangium becharense]